MRTLATLIAIVLTLGAASDRAAAATRYIKPDGSGDSPTIQAGVTAAASGDTVLLAPGVYTGAGNINVDLQGRAIVVISETGAHETIIDCQGNGRGFLFQTGETGSSVLSGVTIRNGSTIDKGGGIYIDGADPTIENNIISTCWAVAQGGAIRVRGNAVIRNNTIVFNSTSAQGGGIAVENGASQPVISNNIIAFNTGEALACRNASMPFVSCNDFYGNSGGDAVCGTDLGDNFTLDPEFCGAPDGNYYLQSDSPCTASNSPCGMLVGALDVNCGIVSAQQHSWGVIKSFYQD